MPNLNLLKKIIYLKGRIAKREGETDERDRPFIDTLLQMPVREVRSQELLLDLLSQYRGPRIWNFHILSRKLGRKSGS